MSNMIGKANSVLAVLDGMTLNSAVYVLSLAQAVLDRCERRALSEVTFDHEKWPAAPDISMFLESMYSRANPEATSPHGGQALPNNPDSQSKTGAPAEAKPALKSSGEQHSDLGGSQ